MSLSNIGFGLMQIKHYLCICFTLFKYN